MTCALHGWQWELATGTCLTSDGHLLYARPVGEPRTPTHCPAGSPAADAGRRDARRGDLGRRDAAMIAGVERADD